MAQNPFILKGGVLKNVYFVIDQEVNNFYPAKFNISFVTSHRIPRYGKIRITMPGEIVIVDSSFVGKSCLPGVGM